MSLGQRRRGVGFAWKDTSNTFVLYTRRLLSHLCARYAHLMSSTHKLLTATRSLRQRRCVYAEQGRQRERAHGSARDNG